MSGWLKQQFFKEKLVHQTIFVTIFFRVKTPSLRQHLLYNQNCFALRYISYIVSYCIVLFYNVSYYFMPIGFSIMRTAWTRTTRVRDKPWLLKYCVFSASTRGFENFVQELGAPVTEVAISTLATNSMKKRNFESKAWIRSCLEDLS